MKKTLEKFIGSTIGECQKLGWFGFSADPPTLAHRAVVDAVLGSGLVEKLVVFISGIVEYKHFQVTDMQRAEMVELWLNAAGFNEEVIVSRFDVSHGKSYPWYDLWCKISQFAPKLDHYLIVGSDQYLAVPISWRKGSVLLNEANFIIAPRADYPVYEIGTNHYLLSIEALAGSSTAAREGNLDILDEQVRTYILEHQLYGFNK